MEKQTLLFDADDTLWENNIYFERAISSFISYLDHRLHTPEEVRDHLNVIERATIDAEGYGLKSFRKSLIRCFENLTDAPVTAEKHQRIVSFVDSIAEQEIEILPGVAETLAELSKRHRCLLVTKGDPGEQHDKLIRSGLSPYFEAVEVLPEKLESSLPCAGGNPRLRGGQDVDDRQQPKVGHQSCARRGAARRVYPARLYLGAGA